MGGKQNEPMPEEQQQDVLSGTPDDDSVPTLNEENEVNFAGQDSNDQQEAQDELPENNEPAESADVSDSIETLSQEIENLKRKADDNLNKAIRAQAELDNVLKRTSRDIENAHKYALEKFVTELLPVLDSLELGISATDNVEDIASLREGMDLTLKKFVDTLGKFGVEVIDPQDQKFDPELHEAVSMQELENAEPGSVISVMQKGYSLNGRLVRPAMVMVAK